MVDYRVVCGVACYWIQVDDKERIIDAAPIAKAWIGSYLLSFRRAFPRAFIRRICEDKDEK